MADPADRPTHTLSAGASTTVVMCSSGPPCPNSIDGADAMPGVVDLAQSQRRTSIPMCDYNTRVISLLS
jgi:hypothetical protein